MVSIANSTNASEWSKVPLSPTARQPLSSLLYPKIAKASPSYGSPLLSPTVPHPGKLLPSPSESSSTTHPEWPSSPASTRCTPLIVLSPATELTSPMSPTSPFPSDLPPRPQPVRTGNFISRLFMRAPAHPYDMELGTLPQRRIREAHVTSIQGEQRKRNERVMRIKIAGVALVIIGFWGLVGMEIWMRQRGKGLNEIGGVERRRWMC